MNKPESQQPASQTRPITDLYIFHLKGCLYSEYELFGKDYIGNWEEDGYSFLFFTRSRSDKIKNLLIAQPHLTVLDNYHMIYDEWLGEKFSAFKAGRFLIAPPWENNDGNASDVKILLDPGLVFGTGSHPTTHSCLQALDLICYHEKVESVLDLGTGTGLLSLAAARLGCEKILAVDNNHLAAKTARDNVRLNGLDNRILVVRGSAKDFMDYPTDLVIANIDYDVIKHLIRSDGFLKKKWWILSGLLRSPAREVSAQLARQSIEILKTWTHDGIWHTFCLKLC